MTRKEESDFERIVGEDYQKSNCLPPVWPEPVVMQLYWSKEAPPSILLNR